MVNFVWLFTEKSVPPTLVVAPLSAPSPTSYSCYYYYSIICDSLTFRLLFSYSFSFNFSFPFIFSFSSSSALPLFVLLPNNSSSSIFISSIFLLNFLNLLFIFIFIFIFIFSLVFFNNKSFRGVNEVGALNFK